MRHVIFAFMFVILITLSSCVPNETPENTPIEPLICSTGFHEEAGLCVADEVIEQPVETPEPLVCDEGLYEKDGACVTLSETCEIGYNPLFNLCVEPLMKQDISGFSTTYPEGSNLINSHMITHFDYSPNSGDVCFDLKLLTQGYNNLSLSLTRSTVPDDFNINTSMNFVDVNTSNRLDQHLCFWGYDEPGEYEFRLTMTYKISAFQSTTVPLSRFIITIPETKSRDIVDVTHFEVSDVGLNDAMISLEIRDLNASLTALDLVVIDAYTQRETDIQIPLDISTMQHGVLRVDQLHVEGLRHSTSYAFVLMGSGYDGVDDFTQRSISSRLYVETISPDILGLDFGFSSHFLHIEVTEFIISNSEVTLTYTLFHSDYFTQYSSEGRAIIYLYSPYETRALMIYLSEGTHTLMIPRESFPLNNHLEVVFDTSSFFNVRALLDIHPIWPD